MQFIFCLSVLLPLVAAAPKAGPEPLYANGKPYADIGALRDDCGHEIGRLYKPDCCNTGVCYEPNKCCPAGTSLVDYKGRRGCASYYDDCDYDCGDSNGINPDSIINAIANDALDVSYTSYYGHSRSHTFDDDCYNHCDLDDNDCNACPDYRRSHRSHYPKNRPCHDRKSRPEINVDVEINDSDRHRGRRYPYSSPHSLYDLENRYPSYHHGLGDNARLVEDRCDGTYHVVEDIKHYNDDVKTIIGHQPTYTAISTIEICPETTYCPTPTVTVVNVPAYNIQPTPVSTYIEPVYVRIPTHTVHNIPVPGFTPNGQAFDFFRGSPGYHSGRFYNHNNYKEQAPSYLTINPGPTTTYVTPPYASHVEPYPCPTNCPNPCCYPLGETVIERPSVSICPGGIGYRKQIQGKEGQSPKDKSSIAKEIVSPQTNTSAESIKDNMKVKARNKNKEEEKKLREMRTEYE